MSPLGELSQFGDWQVFVRGPGPEQEKTRVLLLPGGFCTALTYVDVVSEPSLSEAGITTFAANPPGFADNAPPEGFGHSTSEYAESVEVLAREQRLNVLVGHSLSANILIEVAARGNFNGPVVLLGPCLRRSNEYRGVRLLRRLEAIGPLASRAYANTSKNFRSTMRGLIRPERLDEIVADMEKTPPEQNRAVINGYFDHLARYGTLASRLADARGEIHYVRGDAESIGFDREDRRRIVDQENIQTHTISGADHMMMLDNPAEVARLICRIAEG